ncbi:MAG: class I SAM-dependent methyltransferase [Bryobacteraceae bacterium]|nr:class I SAM-dependent methyltransferase [Bryobacteraceae bacterium]
MDDDCFQAAEIETQKFDVRAHNRAAWERAVKAGNPWTVPVSAADIALARQGQWSIVLTPTKPIPRTWFPSLNGLDVLCLASGGGQQGPILAAAGAKVTVLDNSPGQLQRDHEVAERHSLSLKTVEGDMRDLSMFARESFDVIVHPVANCFIPEIRPAWQEAFRVLRHDGLLLAGFTNPVRYLFDEVSLEQGELRVRHRLPYSDLESLTEAERRQRIDRGEPLEFGHTLEDQIGGQLEAGFILTGFYEDRSGAEDRLSDYMATFIATRAVKR